MKREHQQQSSNSSTTTGSASVSAAMGSVSVSGKNKMWQEEKERSLQPDAGVDELLAVLGYKVKTSDMADVAQKLEQLEMAMGAVQEDDLITHLSSSDTVHFNPSDLSNWVQSMLTEINPSPNSDLISSSSQHIDDPVTALATQSCSSVNSSSILFQDLGSDDLTVIPGDAICAPEREKKRLKSSSPSQSQSLSALVRPVVLVDSQENGIRLVHTILACAEAIQQENFQLAGTLVKQVGLLAISQAGAMRKVATHFVEALARRIYRIYPEDTLDSSSISELFELHFYTISSHVVLIFNCICYHFSVKLQLTNFPTKPNHPHISANHGLFK
ncbi:Della protein gai [Thalictrum thalictroides]|uniref:Della protein gai n=1 Tax=Thalictrum thalictroides TaxID=46969 RepID=A0A7J6URX4_THATH|nr:Della protein gai [Thalictrum thalictroides]